MAMSFGIYLSYFMSPNFDVVIPTFNGLELLKKHLPAIYKHTPHLHQVIIVDNASTDGTAEFLAEKYPGAVCLYQPKNLFFTKAVNLGFKAATAPLVVLLNNDVAVLPHYLDRTTLYFHDPEVFAVTLNEINSSWPDVKWLEGKFQYSRGKDKIHPHFSAWASGGSSVIRRSHWLKLDGFDEIYSPGYWEDIDLGWRAWKTGYKIIWEPRSKVEHQHESSFSKLDPTFVSLIKERNELLFTWKNISDRQYLISHLKFLIRYSLTHPGYLKVIALALRQISQIKKSTGRFSDREIMSSVNQVCG